MRSIDQPDACSGRCRIPVRSSSWWGFKILRVHSRNRTARVISPGRRTSTSRTGRQGGGPARPFRARPSTGPRRRAGEPERTNTSAHASTCASRRAATKSSSPSRPRRAACAVLVFDIRQAAHCWPNRSPGTRQGHDLAAVLDQPARRRQAENQIVDRRSVRTADADHDELGTPGASKLHAACPAIPCSRTACPRRPPRGQSPCRRAPRRHGTGCPAASSPRTPRRAAPRRGRSAVVGQSPARWRRSWPGRSVWEQHAPRTPVAHDRIEPQPPDRDDHVGIGEVPIEVDPRAPPSWSPGRRAPRRGRVMDSSKAMPRGRTSRSAPPAAGVATTVMSPASTPAWPSSSPSTCRTGSIPRCQSSTAMATRSPGTTICRHGGKSIGCSRAWLTSFAKRSPVAPDGPFQTPTTVDSARSSSNRSS